MYERIHLNHHWKVTGIGPEGNEVGPFDATVPGHVHIDLLKQGLIPDPMWRDQALQTQWIETYSWMYETEFHWPETKDRDAAVLRFEGLDTIACIEVNGEVVGTADNMFISYSFPIGQTLVAGTNRVRVHFTSVSTYLKDKEVNKYTSLFSQDRVFLRKMQCTFGWDWVHRLVSYGIWRPVYVECKPEGEIGSTFVRTLDLDGDTATLAWGTEALSRTGNGFLHVELLDGHGKIIWKQTEQIHDVGRSGFEGQVTVDHPNLWWPVGYGAPNLYYFRVRLLSEHGRTVDEKTEEIGIRTFEVERIPDNQGESFTILVNGIRVFAKGGNWVPADPFPSRVTKGRYEHLLQVLVDGNMNMLRVWGGGTYELPEFWRACNRLGIMVSVDFMMACAQYPEHESWFEHAMRIEVEHAIKELRNHPSLVLWSGDNELAMNSNSEDDYWGKHICEQVTEPLCAQWDPTRPFFPTSPYLGRPFNSQDEGDCHYSSWYDMEFILGDQLDYRDRIKQGRGRFLSECVSFGAPPMSSLLKMMTMEDITDKNAEMWEFHTKDNPYNGQDELTHHRMLEKTADALFGPSLDPFMRTKKLEYVQYEFSRLQAEHYRRRKYASSGILFWMYNDCWPASGHAMIDYHGLPKAGYYGAKKAFTPVMISFEDHGGELAVWMVNDTLEDREGQITITSMTTDGQEISEAHLCASVPANSSVMVRKMDKGDLGLLHNPANTVVQGIWREGGTVERVTYFDVLPVDLKLAPAELIVNWVANDPFSGVIQISSVVYARVVSIDEELILEDNYFELMPGETRSVKYRTISGKLEKPPRVTCWNGSENLLES